VCRGAATSEATSSTSAGLISTAASSRSRAISASRSCVDFSSEKIDCIACKRRGKSRRELGACGVCGASWCARRSGRHALGGRAPARPWPSRAPLSRRSRSCATAPLPASHPHPSARRARRPPARDHRLRPSAARRRHPTPRRLASRLLPREQPLPRPHPRSRRPRRRRPWRPSSSPSPRDAIS